jgi:hypothetical protein
VWLFIIHDDTAPPFLGVKSSTDKKSKSGVTTHSEGHVGNLGNGQRIAENARHEWRLMKAKCRAFSWGYRVAEIKVRC